MSNADITKEPWQTQVLAKTPAKTPAKLLIVKSSESRVAYRAKNKTPPKREKVHCHLRNTHFVTVKLVRDDDRRNCVALPSTSEQRRV